MGSKRRYLMCMTRGFSVLCHLPTDKRLAMTVTIEREFAEASRYLYDTKLPKDFFSLSTEEDAYYYGNWASAQRLTLFSYCEGDCTTTVCETQEEFKKQLESFITWSEGMGYKFHGLTARLGADHDEAMLQPWSDLGFADHIL